jgi:hypothetical protein
LFALDVTEVAEKMPQMLPRKTNDIGLIVVSEKLEHIKMQENIQFLLLGFMQL